jgi:hypothetical protein
MEEPVARQSDSIVLCNQLLSLLVVPLHLVRVDTAPTPHSFTVVTHAVEGPQVEQSLLPCGIIHCLHVVG